MSDLIDDISSIPLPDIPDHNGHDHSIDSKQNTIEMKETSYDDGDEGKNEELTKDESSPSNENDLNLNENVESNGKVINDDNNLHMGNIETIIEPTDIVNENMKHEVEEIHLEKDAKIEVQNNIDDDSSIQIPIENNMEIDRGNTIDENDNIDEIVDQINVNEDENDRNVVYESINEENKLSGEQNIVDSENISREKINIEKQEEPNEIENVNVKEIQDDEFDDIDNKQVLEEECKTKNEIEKTTVENLKIEDGDNDGTLCIDEEPERINNNDDDGKTFTLVESINVEETQSGEVIESQLQNENDDGGVDKGKMEDTIVNKEETDDEEEDENVVDEMGTLGEDGEEEVGHDKDENKKNAMSRKRETEIKKIDIETFKNEWSDEEEEQIEEDDDNVVLEESAHAQDKTVVEQQRIEEINVLHPSGNQTVVEQHNNEEINVLNTSGNQTVVEQHSNEEINVLNTSGNSAKSTSTFDENAEENMLIEEITQDEDVVYDDEPEQNTVIVGNEEAVMVIGGANGENLEDFVIVNENNEEQEIYEEIDENGRKTYYVKVKQTSGVCSEDVDMSVARSVRAKRRANRQDANILVENSDTYCEEPELHDASIKKNEDSVLYEGKKGRMKKTSKLDQNLSRELALKQLAEFNTNKKKKPKPPVTPKRRPQECLDDVSMKIQIKTVPDFDKKELEKRVNLSKEKVERTIELLKEEKSKELLAKTPVKNKIEKCLPSRKRNSDGQCVELNDSLEQSSGANTPSRKSTRLKIENQTLKDYALDMPESYSNSYGASMFVCMKENNKQGRPSKRRLLEDVETSDSKRFMISYPNKKRAPSPDGPNPVIPPLIIENGKDIVDQMLSGDETPKHNQRGTSVTEDNLIIVEASKKKKFKSLDVNTNTSTTLTTENINETPEQETTTCTEQTEIVDSNRSHLPKPVSSQVVPKQSSTTPNAVQSPKTIKNKVLTENIVLESKKIKTRIPANTWNVVTSDGGETESKQAESNVDTPSVEVKPTRKRPVKQVKKAKVFLAKDQKDEEKKRQNKMMREINKLLSDEGAIDMLYSVSQKRRGRGEAGQDNKTNLKSRKTKKALLLKTKLVKDAVLNSSAHGDENETQQGRLRKSGSTMLVKQVSGKKKQAISRKQSVDSVLSSVSESATKAAFLTKESVIFRRHSSDSSCSSTGGQSPRSRISTDEKQNESSQEVQNSPSECGKKLKKSLRQNLLKLTNKKSRNSASKSTVVTQSPSSSVHSKTIEEVEQELEHLFAEDSTPLPQKTDIIKEKETEPIRENEPIKVSEESPNTSTDSESVITVKIAEDLAYISFSNENKNNYLTLNILNELTATLVYLDRQDACKTILMMGSGFAQGLNLTFLINEKKNKRRKHATSLANAVKVFVTTLLQLGKPILLAVEGAVEGLAVTILPLFDFVLASKNSTFETFYPKLGQIPEGGATFTFPLFLGRNATSELLMNCKKISAQEAKSFNLITRIANEDAFEKNAEFWAKEICKYSAQSMQTTKLLLRRDLYSKLDETLDTETDFLIEHWTSEEVQKNLRKHLSSRQC